MLAPSNDYGYTSGHHNGMAHHHLLSGGYEPQHHQHQHHQHQHQHEPQQVHHSDERPKLFSLDPHGAMGGHHQTGSLADFQHLMHGGHHQQQQAPPPSQSHMQHGGDYDHEPLMMNMNNPSSHFYAPMGAQMLHVSADYAAGVSGYSGGGSSSDGNGATPSSSRGGNSNKRSREELNMKEKKRMFKLNDRITELKTLLDEAGVQTKKNKQSVLDNTFHYIGMLRSNLVIAKQKAERAEKQAAQFRMQVEAGSSDHSRETSPEGAGALFKQCFHQSATPRVVVGLDWKPVAVNTAFERLSGHTAEALATTAHLRASLCVDDAKLSSMVRTLVEEGRPTNAVVQSRTATGLATVTLVASASVDDAGKVSCIEFTVVPLERDACTPSTKSENENENENEKESESESERQDTAQEASPAAISELAL